MSTVFPSLQCLKFFIVIICSVSTISSFNVKVLLQKNTLSDLKDNTINVQSEQGFILSTHPFLSWGYEYKERSIDISVSNGSVLMNGKPLHEKVLYLSPALFKSHLARLKSYTSYWVESSGQCLFDFACVVYPLFDQIVSQDDPLDSKAYDVIDVYFRNVLQLFLKDFLCSIEDEPVMTAETLLSYADNFFNNKIKILFLESLAAKHLDGRDRKKLEKNKQYRHDFFLHELNGAVQKLLYEFVASFPRKLLQQFFKQPTGCIEFNDYCYLGSFILFQDKKQLYLINSLDIDDYLLSVVKHESFPGWPLEMNKVMAVACRTYLAWQVLQAKKIDRPYHLEDGIRHQTYKGFVDSPKLKQAIDETRDLFVAYDGRPACTQYDSCCGGIVPSLIDDPDHKRVPYLARSYPCTFCKKFKVFDWQIDFSNEEIIKRLLKDFSGVTKIVDISVHKKDKAGLAKKILINVGSRKIIISEKKMKSLFPEIRSSCYDISKHSGKRYSIVGKGFGHHKGLCQWGAKKLVSDEHWNFVQVLQFYYPGTKLMKLTYQR